MRCVFLVFLDSASVTSRLHYKHQFVLAVAPVFCGTALAKHTSFIALQL
jgi:hypothetical protein